METQKTQKPHRSVFKNISEMENAIGKELGLTPWKIMDQERINTFAKATSTTLQILMYIFKISGDGEILKYLKIHL